MVGDAIEFDWDDENRKHLMAHKVAPMEFEQVLLNNPLDLHYELAGNEEAVPVRRPDDRRSPPIRGMDNS